MQNHHDGATGRRGRLLVLVGPTAVGKTELSLALAQRFDAEIVSADSRLFYTGMDIGTAKPTAAERALVRHHLIDICAPDETVTLGQYQRMAYRTIDGILERGRLPLLVGGTGQYVMAVVEGWGIPEIAPRTALRRQLERLGTAEASRWLAALDPAAAERLDPRNLRRVVRALEVVFVSGRPISELQRKAPPPYDMKLIGLQREREELYDRIDRRVDDMLRQGLIGEVVALDEAGYEGHVPAMSGLGYRQILAYIHGEMDLAEAVERIKFETHRFARQQANWFRQDDPRISWFPAGDEEARALIFHEVQAWLSAPTAET